eukprot:TRINITY_DN6438_c0_g1_i4.p1 TRINITY_DN6438_c0_g1~~TRINITY_DN6438_c0_g1_i4.p1  ORF type:complete len:351 (-),score=45.54 TRINITY_DN6438_c0_g1_i4:166-1218(-)
MADTAHKDPEQILERFDSEEEFETKIKEVASIVQQSKHLIFFTGAGISTSAGISDFRGPEGVWTRRAQGLPPKSGTSTLSAIPTSTHMAIKHLIDIGTIKYLVSQNTDGLHRRSGIPANKISELHGNSNIEKCEKCRREYVRDFRCRTAKDVHDHKTGRLCESDDCKGNLMDSIINFGEKLPSEPLMLAFLNADEADVCIALGSSLTVTPAADVPKTVGKKKGGKLIICNLQKTPLDHLAAVRIFEKTDLFIIRLMELLKQKIPPFILKRRVVIGNDFNSSDGTWNIFVRGLDTNSDYLPASILQRVELRLPKYYTNVPKSVLLKKEPFSLNSIRLEFIKSSILTEDDVK